MASGSGSHKAPPTGISRATSSLNTALASQPSACLTMDRSTRSMKKLDSTLLPLINAGNGVAIMAEPPPMYSTTVPYSSILPPRHPLMPPPLIQAVASPSVSNRDFKNRVSLFLRHVFLFLRYPSLLRYSDSQQPRYELRGIVSS